MKIKEELVRGIVKAYNSPPHGVLAVEGYVRGLDGDERIIGNGFLDYCLTHRVLGLDESDARRILEQS